MLLCLDVGNTHVLGGVFDKDNLVARFRYATHLIGTADQFGMFLLNILQANKIAPATIKAISIGSVVPSYDYTLRRAMSIYLSSAKLFVLAAGEKTGVNVKTKNPGEVGSDLIASAIGAIAAFPNQNIIIIDMGTATTVCAVTKKRDYLGVSILPGMRLSMESLKNNTAKLMEVDLEEPSQFIGRATKESIQSGLYFGHLGALKEIVAGYKREAFPSEPVLIVGTGGFAQLFRNANLFDELLPDLVLHGLAKAYEYADNKH